MPGGRLELPRHRWHRLLGPARLPFRHPGPTAATDLPRGARKPRPRQETIHNPKSCASTSSATVARLLRFNLRGRAPARHRRLGQCRVPAPPCRIFALPRQRRATQLSRMMVTAVNWARLKVDGPYRLRRGPEGRRTVPTAPRGVVRGEGGRERRGASPREREVGARAVAGGRGDRVAAEPLDRRAASRERRDDSRKLGGALCRVPTVPPPRPLTGPAADHAVPAVRQAFPGGVGRGLSRTEVTRGCAAIAPVCGWLSTLRLTTDN